MKLAYYLFVVLATVLLTRVAAISHDSCPEAFGESWANLDNGNHVECEGGDFCVDLICCEDENFLFECHLDENTGLDSCSCSRVGCCEVLGCGPSDPDICNEVIGETWFVEVQKNANCKGGVLCINTDESCPGTDVLCTANDEPGGPVDCSCFPDPACCQTIGCE